MWALLLWAGCNGQPPIFEGIGTYSLFPFDCERTWEYISTDTTLAYKLLAISDTEPETLADATKVYTLEYTTNCLGASPDCVDGEVLRKVQWSSTIGDGVFIHGYALGEGAVTKFDPPLQVALDEMQKGQVVTTTTGGATWTSEMVEIESCPVQMSVDWPECYVFEITTDGGDGVPVAGTYWATGSQNVVAMEVAGDTGQWQLSSTSAAESETMGKCDGEW